MIRTIKRYTVIDPNAKAFWIRNIHYGYTNNNKPVFDTRFTEDLSEATLMERYKAEQVLEAFSEQEYINGGQVKVDGQALVIRAVHISYEIDL